MAPRARLFRRDANSVSTLEDLKSIMRFELLGVSSSVLLKVVQDTTISRTILMSKAMPIGRFALVEICLPILQLEDATTPK